MANNVYIGARYVPKFFGDWNNTRSYEALSIVMYGNNTYTSKRPVPAGTLPTDTTYWAMTGNYNGAIIHLQDEINDINSVLTKFDEAIKNTRKLHGNLLLNYNYEFTNGGGTSNGSCYIGNNQVVTYFSDFTSNLGRLVCFNIKTHVKVWEHNINAYHGNSITYNPDTHKIYICGAINNATNDGINTIIEIDAYNPSVILREFSLPSITECYSLTYDKTRKKFYAIAYRGTTAGVSDMVFVYDDTLTNMESAVQLDNFPAVDYGISTQGVQLAIDGIIYVPSYTPSCRAIFAYNIDNGKCVSISNIPPIINYCRSVGEIESLVYDYDNDAFIVGSILYYTGVHKYYSHMLFEVDMYKSVAEFKPEPSDTLNDIPNNGALPQFICVPAGDSLKPSWLIAPYLATVPNDAIIYSKHNQVPVTITMANSNSGVTSLSDTLGGLDILGFRGAIEGYVGGLTPVHNFNVEGPCNVVLRRLKFDGYELTQLASGFYGNVFAKQLAEIYFQNCTFDSYAATGNDKYHIVAYNGAKIYSFGSTFNGTVDNNVKLALGASYIDS